MDVLAVEEAARKAIESVRSGGGPHFLELRTFRFRAHSMFDPELYRSKEEVEVWKERDPIELFKRRLITDGALTEDDWADIEKEVAEEVERAVEFAEAGTWEPVEELTRFVYSEVVPS
jgi:TPP-dependent pyruvate/acetoin dehydrogenase alpha subunit